MSNIPFIKMQGSGNDFVVLDGRQHALQVTSHWALVLADRHKGIGCDQLIVLGPSAKGDVFMRIFNADGGEVKACGNATLCMGWKLMQEKKKDRVVIETEAGLLECWRQDEWGVTVDMGIPGDHWKDIPLSEPRNTLHLGIAEGELMDPVAVSMGNPHAVFFVKDVARVRLKDFGPKLEHNPLFPQRANISAVQVISEDHIKLRVWERGVGETLACGTAACASVVAAVRRSLTKRQVQVELPGGTLGIEWRDDKAGSHGHVLMSGQVAEVFRGEFSLGLLL